MRIVPIRNLVKIDIPGGCSGKIALGVKTQTHQLIWDEKCQFQRMQSGLKFVLIAVLLLYALVAERKFQFRSIRHSMLLT